MSQSISRIELLSDETSTPFGTSYLPRSEIGVDLDAVGYVEEEFLISGLASTWTYDDQGLSVVADADLSFTTRILVRRPTDPSRSSGVVQLEPLHPDLDSALTWGALHGWIIREGHAWVGVTVYTHMAHMLTQMLSPSRYAELSISSPGQEFDVLGTVARAIKIGEIPGIECSTLILSGWSATGSFTRVFLQDGFHERCIDDTGHPAVDGYAICISSGGAGAAGFPPLSPGTPELAATDPRRTVRGHGAIAFEILSETESETHGTVLRADSDAAEDRYRLYQVAGTAHVENRPFQALSNNMQFTLAGGQRPNVTMVEQPSDARLDLVARSLFSQLVRWIQSDEPAPRAERLVLEPIRGWPIPLVRDADGNAIAGIRTPWIEAPTASYSPHSTPSADNEPLPSWMPFSDLAILAGLFGSRVPFARSEAEARYGSQDNYRKRFTAAVDEAVSLGFLLPADATELIESSDLRWPA